MGFRLWIGRGFRLSLNMVCLSLDWAMEFEFLYCGLILCLVLVCSFYLGIDLDWGIDLG